MPKLYPLHNDLKGSIIIVPPSKCAKKWNIQCTMNWKGMDMDIMYLLLKDFHLFFRIVSLKTVLRNSTDISSQNNVGILLVLCLNVLHVHVPRQKYLHLPINSPGIATFPLTCILLRQWSFYCNLHWNRWGWSKKWSGQHSCAPDRPCQRSLSVANL